jgi:hypothetical protein
MTSVQPFSLHYTLCAGGYSFNHGTTLKLQLVQWTSVGVIAVYLKPLVLITAAFLLTSVMYNSSQSYLTIDGHSASLSRCQVTIWDPRPIFPLKNDIFWDVTPCGSCENVHFGGTSVLTRATRCNVPADTIRHSHRRENLKSYNFFFLFDFFLHITMSLLLWAPSLTKRWVI